MSTQAWVSRKRQVARSRICRLGSAGSTPKSKLPGGLHLVEVGASDAGAEGIVHSALDLVLQQEFDEVEVAQVLLLRLGNPGLEGGSHAGQLEGLQLLVQVVDGAHVGTPCGESGASSSSGPRRYPSVAMRAWVGRPAAFSWSSPRSRMVLMVR